MSATLGGDGPILEHGRPSAVNGRRRRPPRGRPKIRWEGDIVVVVPQGAFEEESADDLAQLIASEGQPVIVDLDECVLIDGAAIGRLDPLRWCRTPREACLACRRFSARRLLERFGANRRLYLFPSVEDALQARTLEVAGFGPGWSLDVVATSDGADPIPEPPPMPDPSPLPPPTPGRPPGPMPQPDPRPM